MGELAHAFHHEPAGAVVLYGRCDEDLAIPYRPFVESLAHLAAHVDGRVLATVDSASLGELTRLVPAFAERRPGLPAPASTEPEVERYLLFEAVAALVAAVAQNSPVLLVVDDLHWADRRTLQLLRHLAAQRLDRVLLVATFRHTEQASGPLVDALAALQREAAVTRIVPRALTESETRALLRGMSDAPPADLDGELAAYLLRQTGGNAFYLVEMLSHLRETGVLAAGQGDAAIDLPDGIRDVLRARLARLGDDTAQVLAQAAVIGQDFDVDVLAESAGLDVNHVVDLLEGVARAALVEESGPPGRFRFTHALVQHTLYADLGATRRTHAHARVALAMETLGGYQPGELAFHALAGMTAKTTDRAVRHARAAGAAALAASAPDDAVRWYGAALNALPAPREVAALAVEVPSDESLRCELLLALGDAQRRAGDPGHRETLLEAAHLAARLGNVDALARAALANNRGAWYSVAGDLDLERVAVLEAALEAVGDEDSTVRARLMATLATELVFSPDRQRRTMLSDAALTMARRLDDPRAIAEVLSARYYAILAPSNLPERLENTAELLAVAARVDDPVLSNRAAWFRYRATTEAADITEAERQLAAVEHFTALLRQPWLWWTLGFAKTGLTLLRGHVDEADRLASETLALGQAAGDPEAPFIYALARFQLLLDRGRRADAEQALAELGRDGTPQPLLESMQALLRVEHDDDEVHARLDRHARAEFADVAVNNTWLMTLTNWAAASARTGHRASAELLSDMLLPNAGQLPLFAGTVNGVVAFYLGLLANTLGRRTEADQWFREAADVHARIEAPIWLAHTNLA